MRRYYYVQVNDYMQPARILLTEDEADTIIYVLKEIAKSDKDSLVAVCDEDGTELYGNYDEWIKTHRD